MAADNGSSAAVALKSGMEIVAQKAEDTLWRASLSVSGMSCSSCVAAISEALQTKPWITSTDVAFLSNSASVTFYGRHHLDEIIETIEDSGFDASPVSCADMTVPAVSSIRRDTWRAVFAVEGMTCSSCVGTITRGLDTIDCVELVEVKLLSNSATVTFLKRDNVNIMLEAIEKLGYDAQLTSFESLTVSPGENHTRTASILVDGMSGNDSPALVLKALEAQAVIIEEPLTLGKPVVKITYKPRPPDFTIRSVLSAISAADSVFKPAMYHALSLEERSRRIQARHKRRLLLRVTLAVIVAVPTFIIGIVCADLLPAENPARRYLNQPTWSGNVTRVEWALFIMATPVYFLAADIFHRGMLSELHTLWRRNSKVPLLERFYRFGSMNMLISLGVSIAYFSSIAVLAIQATQPGVPTSEGESTYFDAVVFLTMFLLIGRTIEAYTKAKAGDTVTELGKLRPSKALLVEELDNPTKEKARTPEYSVQPVPVDTLERGDLVRVPQGSSPPCDGTITEIGAGDMTSIFDESSLTGESKLIKKIVGDEVFAGTVNRGSSITLRISQLAGDSMLDQIVAAVREGQTKRAPIERLADILISYFTPFVTFTAVVVWIIWLSLGLSGALPRTYLDVEVGGWAFWSLEFAVAVFVIACPCGIGLAAPTALFVGGGLAAKNGILVKGGGEAFQEASSLDVVVFDKTGTLTQGTEPMVTDIETHTTDSIEESVLLAMVKTSEETSGHPLAKALVAYCETSQPQFVPNAIAIDEVAGKGLRGVFDLPGTSDKTELLVGNEALMSDHDIRIPKADAASLDSWKAQGKSVVVVAVRPVSSANELACPGSAWTVAALFAIADPLRQESVRVVQALHDRRISVWMISGDNYVTASAVGRMVGIPTENIIAGVLPQEKADKIKHLQQTLKKPDSSTTRALIAMVGDGINDSPALTAADVGIAIGSGSDVAISSAAFVLVSSNLDSVLKLLDLSRTVFNRIKFNFAWALVYNLIAVPVAAGVLYPIKSNGSHVRLDPVWASLAMALSSLSVITSSLLLRTTLPFVGFRANRSKNA